MTIVNSTVIVEMDGQNNAKHILQAQSFATFNTVAPIRRRIIFGSYISDLFV